MTMEILNGFDIGDAGAGTSAYSGAGAGVDARRDEGEDGRINVGVSVNTLEG